MTPRDPDEQAPQDTATLRAKLASLEKIHQEHLETREALRRSENRYRTLIENAPLGIIVTDAQGNILVVNKALLNILGSPSAEATQAINVLNFPPLIKAGVADDFRRCIETGTRVVSEHPYRTKWGKQTYLRYHLTPLKDEAGNLVGLQGIIEDFSERKRFEDAIKRAHEELSRTAQELRAANEELTQFATAVSHDLKAPLRAIRHFATELIEDHGERLPEGARTCVDRILGALDHADELVAGLLALARLGRHRQVSPPVDLKSFLEELVETLSLPEKAKVVIAPCQVTVRADPVLLRQIFQNLLVNGVKFNDSPEPTVRVTCTESSDGMVVVEVADNGIGIHPRYHDRIFNVFERLHSRAEYEGTGVGLALVKKAVTKLGGSIGVVSQPGQGATFVVRLPNAARSTPPLAPGAQDGTSV